MEKKSHTVAIFVILIRIKNLNNHNVLYNFNSTIIQGQAK